MSAMDRPEQAGPASGRAWSVASLAERLGAEVRGDASLVFDRLDPVGQGGAQSLTFVRDERRLREWERGGAGGALVARSAAPSDAPAGRVMLIVDDADAALRALLEETATPHVGPVGRHPTSVVHESATLGENVRLGAHCVVGPGCVIGDGVSLGAGVVLGAGVTIGEGCDLRANVVVEDWCALGEGCLLHPGVVIGADGFGYARGVDARTGLAGPVKIPHAGAVRIGRSVEIGANTTVDRGKLGDTLIGDGTKIDNLVQIGHNCVVGRSCVICGASALAGSVTLGDGVTLAGAVTIGDNLKVGDGATLGARSAVMNDIPAGESWVGVPAEPMKESMRKYAAWRKLPDALKRLQRLERDRGSAGGGSERGGGSDAG